MQVREYEITKGLHHPRVVRLLDIFEIDDCSFGTVQEICEGGDLDWHLKAHQARATASFSRNLGLILALNKD